MKRWFKLNLGDAMLADAKFDALKKQLTALYKSANNKENLAAYYRHENNGLHCNLIVYLSAEFQQLAKLAHAAPCPAPNLSDISKLIGE